MNILVQGLLIVGGQCHVAKDASNLCSEWGSVSVFSLIVPLKVQPPKLDKKFVIGGYFGTETFECWWAMPSDQGYFKLLL